MLSAQEALTLPSEEEADEAFARFARGWEEVEKLTSRVRKVNQEFDAKDENVERPLPTLADIGSLLVFARQVKGIAQNAQDDADTLTNLAYELEAVRREGRTS